MSDKLPILKVAINSRMWGEPSDGRMEYKYRPFFNLRSNTEDVELEGEDKDFRPKKLLQELRLKAKKANLSIDGPIDMDIEESYDGSANIIVNDRKNPPKLINSRFYLTNSNTYKIGDRKGNVDTNIYSEENFSVESSLIKSVSTLVKVDYLGLSSGGKMPVGNYTFYFKLADSDGNESDFIAESGRVVAHIGNINNPRHIRGGQLNENSGKTINLILNDLDLAYTYINVYYTRNTGTENDQVTTTHKITNSFKIKGIETPINITGYENHEDISDVEINTQYTHFDAVQSITNCQNISFAANTTKNYDLYRRLENLSLYITPELSNEESIGELSENYSERFMGNKGYEYYNTENIYYRLGYWDEEIYRFGIVYILNDYTLSPVFNIRGIKELTPDTIWGKWSQTFNIPQHDVVIQDDHIIADTDGLENSKGVFRINHYQKTGITHPVHGNYDGIRPIGLKFRFHSDIIKGVGGLEDITKGFFIVRQPRIPTILAQSVGIGTTKHGHLPTIKSGTDYLIDSFLTQDKMKKPSLGRSIVKLKSNEIVNNSLLCPEADLRTEIFTSFFNSSRYLLKESKYQPTNHTTDRAFNRVLNTDQFVLDRLTISSQRSFGLNTDLLLVEPGINLIKNGDYKFSSLAGNEVVAHEAIDVKFGDYNDPLNNISDINTYNYSDTKVRGVFNSYIGTNSTSIKQGRYYNIFQDGYDFERMWKEYFKTRINDSTAYFPVSDRIGWVELKSVGDLRKHMSTAFYRGDCYINTFTHRMNWNFIDPELPISDRIVDRYTWYKNWRVSNEASTAINLQGEEEVIARYNKLLPIFTYKSKSIATYSGDKLEDEPIKNFLTSDSKRFKKYSELNGTFGTDKLFRADINAVPLGQWVTLKVCSNINLALRDVDLQRPDEEATFGVKRSFYPLQSMDRGMKLPESRIINNGISKTGGNKYYFDLGDIPFIKDSFTTRIHYSNVLQQSTFVNGNRVFLAKNYQDYSMEHGEIVKIIDWYGTLIAIMEHGVLMIPVNERAMMANESGENVYINTENTLPKNPRVISDTYGTIWPEAVVKTPRYIYGFDSVAKKIWRTDGEHMEIISDLKVQQFLNENIHLRESDRESDFLKISIKLHYNAFKQDVHFVYRAGDISWHLCWNEALNKWVTRYSWFPSFSENINNIFYTFADSIVHKNEDFYLYKHGFSGTVEEQGDIKPTNWYDEQHPFEFEFVVADSQGVQKIFDNLKIISNRVEPNSIIYEFTGDGYEWRDLKGKIVELSKAKAGELIKMYKGFGDNFTQLF